MTRFVDSMGRDWMVREVKDPNLAMIPTYLLTDPEFARGWLLFESSGEKRRLAPYPDDWVHLSAARGLLLARDASRAIAFDIHVPAGCSGGGDTDTSVGSFVRRACL